MTRYKVWICFSGVVAYDVEANSEDEARDIAMEQADAFDCDSWDYEVDSVEDEGDY
jgi:hypothetical protein